MELKPPLDPMLATNAEAIPEEPGWHFEPKWDGFRCLVFWDGHELLLQSRDHKPLNRYFPEVEEKLGELPEGVALDGELVVAQQGALDFEALLQRIHPARSRVKLLARQTPATFVAFDLLAHRGESLLESPFEQRRQRLEQLSILTTPATDSVDLARDWFRRFEGAGFDGIIARRYDQPYLPGQRAMLKIKHRRTADCVVGGYRWRKSKEGEQVGSLLLGLYDHQGVFHYVGFSSSFKVPERRRLAEKLAAYHGPSGFGQGRTPGGPSRWSQGKESEWISLRPELVCEVRYDHLQGARFRHGTTFLRWRPDKPPDDCTYAQLDTVPPAELSALFQ
ncbi:MAG: ATP-dependent DNA ligase [Vulcanimicrobiota bacterium]